MEKNDINQLMINLAKDYYIEDIPITTLTNKYELSRYKILKYLNDAKEQGIITINIQAPYERNYELERLLGSMFDTSFFILKESEDLTNSNYYFWKFSAEIIEDYIIQANIVSLSWGDSIYQIIEQFKPAITENLIFTQFVGEIGKYHSLAGSMRLVQKAASKFEANYLTLTAPLYIINNQARELLALEPLLQKTLVTAEKSDVILTAVATPASITSVDSWNQNKHLLFGDSFNQTCGFAYGRPFDEYGNILNLENDKTFGLSLEQIFKIPKRVCVNNNRFKTGALIGALRGNFFTHMFLNEKSALSILDQLEQ